MRRFTQLTLLAALAARCGPPQRPGARPVPRPDLAAPSLFDAASAYRKMGLLVAGPPLPFVASVRYLADAAPESTLVLFALSLANHSLSFRRDGPQFVAQYHVEVSFRDQAAGVRQFTSDETVRVRGFQETLRADESVVYQQFFGLAPGVYTTTVTLRDRNSPSSTRQEHSDTVPRLGRGLSWLIPVYEGPGRARLGELPNLVVNPRASLSYGGDSLRVYVEAYGMPAGTRLAVRALDQSGTAVSHDTVRLAGDAGFARAQVAFRLGDIPVGAGQLEVGVVGERPGAGGTAGGATVVRMPFLVSFSDQWAITSYDDLISLLRFFERQEWVERLRTAAAAERPVVWREFFKATDPVASTPDNEALEEYFRRVQGANQRFREGGDPGWLTDRGEVFIVLGEPDDVFDFSSDVARSGVRGIRWTYTQLRLTLFFQDQTGFGRFRLTPTSRAEYQRARARRVS